MDSILIHDQALRELLIRAAAARTQSLALIEEADRLLEERLALGRSRVEILTSIVQTLGTFT